MTKRPRSGFPGRPDRSPGWLATMLIALIVAAASLYVYDARYALKVRCVDPGPYIRSQWALVEEKRITREEFEKRLDRLEETLDRQSSNTVVILKDVVLRNGHEIGL